MIEALTTSCRPFSSANSAMISSGALPNVTFSRPPMPGPGAVRELLGRAAHQRRGRHDAERRGEEDDDRVGVRQVEHDRDRDERDEQVRPALPAEQEPPQVEVGAGVAHRCAEHTARGRDDESRA